MGFWRRLFGADDSIVADPWDALVRAQQDEIAYLRAQLSKAQDRIVQMSDPLLESRIVANERARQAPAREPSGRAAPPHNPRLLALRMEQLDHDARAAQELARDPADVERSFRRAE